MKILWAVTVLMIVSLLSFLMFFSKFRLQTVEYKPVEGVVTAKQWVPKSEDMYFMQIPDGNGGFTQIPQWHTNPEKWVIYVGDRKVYVTQDEFKVIEIKGYFKEKR